VQTNGNDLRRRHVGELVGRLGADVGTLVRQELDLARAELAESVEQAKADVTETAKQAGAGAAMFGAAAVAGVLALGALTAAVIIALARVIPADVAAAVVMIAWGLVAAAAALRGRDAVRDARKPQPAQYVPRNTIETLKEDVEWAKTRGRSDAR
jgi:hypothetical protein